MTAYLLIAGLVIGLLWILTGLEAVRRLITGETTVIRTPRGGNPSRSRESRPARTGERPAPPLNGRRVPYRVERCVATPADYLDPDQPRVLRALVTREPDNLRLLRRQQ